MTHLNRIIIQGNLTRDVEFKTLPTGTAVAKIGIASNRTYKDPSTKEFVKETCFMDVAVWGYQAEQASQRLKKGMPIIVEGRIKQDSWKDGQGATKTKHSIIAEKIVFLDSKESEVKEPSFIHDDLPF